MEYLIWSNEHRAWWRPKSAGYTIDPDKAGRYSRSEAISHCRSRDQCPGEPMPELPIREDDLSEVLWTPEMVKLDNDIATA